MKKLITIILIISTTLISLNAEEVDPKTLSEEELIKQIMQMNQENEELDSKIKKLEDENQALESLNKSLDKLSETLKVNKKN